MSAQTKIAVALIIGVGKGDQAEYEREAVKPLQSRLADEIGDDIVFEIVHWTEILQSEKDRVRDGYKQAAQLNYGPLRRFFSGLITDAIAYQPQGEESDTYLRIHKTVATALDNLSNAAGSSSPLVILAHSMGGVIASNYFRELQEDTYKSELLPEEVHDIAGDTPLERGETLAQLYTMGTPLALYSVRHREFDDPISVPSPRLRSHFPPDRYPELPTQWINFYNPNDVLAYPLEFLNKAYAHYVEDRQVNVGDWRTSWNPLSHMDYWGDDEIVLPISEGITRLYHAVNK